MSAGQGDGRGAIRRGVQVAATLREPGSSHRFDVEVIDLSATGVRFKTSVTLKPGARVFLSLRGMEAVETVVAWHRNYVYGARFQRPLHPAVVDHLAAMHKG